MPVFNLLCLHAPPHQQISDFETVRDMIHRRAPDIDVHIVTSNMTTPSDFVQRINARPTVIFSPFAVKVANEIRGTRFVSIPLSKWQELQLLHRHGIPIPATRPLTPDLKLGDPTWGEMTVIKPNSGMLGRGISLMPTKDVRWIDTSALPMNDPRYRRMLLVQRFIDTGAPSRCYRVLTVLGRAIYSLVSIGLDGLSEDEVAVNGMNRTIEMSNEPDIIALARLVHGKFPHLPIMAIDILREAATGRLYVLEYNSPGYSWHLSSQHGRKQQKEFGLDFYGQFNALPTIADALVETTRKYAS